MTPLTSCCGSFLCASLLWDKIPLLKVYFQFLAEAKASPLYTFQEQPGVWFPLQRGIQLRYSATHSATHQETHTSMYTQQQQEKGDCHGPCSTSGQERHAWKCPHWSYTAGKSRAMPSLLLCKSFNQQEISILWDKPQWPSTLPPVHPPLQQLHPSGDHTHDSLNIPQRSELWGR